MKRIAASFLLLFTCFHAFAQPKDVKTKELGIMLGASGYAGELNPYNQFSKLMRPAGGLVFRKALNRRYAFKSSLLYGSIKGDDAQANNAFQKNRNLNFKSILLEVSGQFEFNFLPYELGNPELPWTPYIFCGLSGFYFNPKGNQDGTWRELRPLSTEGQGVIPGKRNYMRTQLSFPFGLGLKANLGDNFAFSMEVGLRRTFTDYLDDVGGTYPDQTALGIAKGPIAVLYSDPGLNQDINNNFRQRGNSQNKDWYSFSGIMITYYLRKKPPECPAYLY
ncbi:MAG: hypothetical protein IPP32_05195 [Bacteroidetes bacterium]|nr:hypothetical protein [Bacteroidota bacterium]